jgi:acyl CoA:acetate/3-ketoacid CoA transferase alpha subunit
VSRNKVITADAAAGLVLDGDTIATTGFVGTGFPEELALALEGNPATSRWSSPPARAMAQRGG